MNRAAHLRATYVNNWIEYNILAAQKAAYKWYNVQHCTSVIYIFTPVELQHYFWTSCVTTVMLPIPFVGNDVAISLFVITTFFNYSAVMHQQAQSSIMILEKNKMSTKLL